MVQFTTTLEVIKRPEAPPVCPKCGSHRTEVIGQSEAEPEKRTLRLQRVRRDLGGIIHF